MLAYPLNATVSFENGQQNSVSLAFTNEAATVPVSPLSSDALAIPVDPSDWESALIGYNVRSDPEGDGKFAITAFAYATVDSVTTNVVPVPGAVWLLGSALGLLGWMRREAA